MLVRRSIFALILATPLALAGCSDSVEDDPDTPDAEVGVTPDATDVGVDAADVAPDLTEDSGPDAAIVVPPYEEGLAAGPTGLRRLTRSQYENIIADVFGTNIVVPPLAEPDLSVKSKPSSRTKGSPTPCC